MRLAKGVKLNIIIAILVCIAFVLNVGSAFGAINYKYTASSIGQTGAETYTEYGSMQGDKGSYVYSVGSVNNALGLNYGFSANYDIAVKFTAYYTNTNHKANDFALEFVDRDKWCIDMAVDQDVKTAGTSYYQLTSTSEKLEGVMYYLDTLSGSGRLPIISGVTFYTNNSHSYTISSGVISDVKGYYTYEGDVLNIELTPLYVKSKAGAYNSNHMFYNESNKLSGTRTALNNWTTYMNRTSGTTIETPAFMLYNAYATGDKGLQFPADAQTMTQDGGGNISMTMPASALTNPSTAYRYKVKRMGTEGNYSYTTTYDNVTGANTYYGGLGVFVLPSSTLKSVSISFSYGWYDTANTELTGSLINPIEYQFSTTNIVESGNKYYSKINLKKPTYINVLDYFMLTADSGFRTAMYNGYRMVVHTFTVTAETEIPSAVSSVMADRQSYTINNASLQSGIMVEQKNWSAGSTFVETDVTIHNTSASDIAITSFTLKGTLWYSSYGNDGWEQTPNGKYLKPQYQADGTTIADAWVSYDTNLWSVSYDNNTYTFTRKTGANVIPSGYGMTLIDGVRVAQQDYPTVYDAVQVSENETEYVAYVHDLWCSLEVTVNLGTAYTSGQTGYTGLEVTTDGYYSTFSSESPAKIYVRNNTNQAVSNIALQSLVLYPVKAGKPMRNNINTSGETISYTATNYTSNVTLQPNEKKLMFVITPASECVIYSYSVSCTVSSSTENVKRVINEESGTVDIINNSGALYEFRLKSSKNLASMVNSDFIVGNNGTNYYAYYKGVICANQMIRVLNRIGTGFDVDVQLIPHTQGWDETHYVAGNYSTFSDDTSTALSSWLGVMAGIYVSTITPTV